MGTRGGRKNADRNAGGALPFRAVVLARSVVRGRCRRGGRRPDGGRCLLGGRLMPTTANPYAPPVQAGSDDWPPPHDRSHRRSVWAFEADWSVAGVSDLRGRSPMVILRLIGFIVMGIIIYASVEPFLNGAQISKRSLSRQIGAAATSMIVPVIAAWWVWRDRTGRAFASKCPPLAGSIRGVVDGFRMRVCGDAGWAFDLSARGPHRKTRILFEYQTPFNLWLPIERSRTRYLDVDPTPVHRSVDVDPEIGLLWHWLDENTIDDSPTPDAPPPGVIRAVGRHRWSERWHTADFAAGCLLLAGSIALTVCGLVMTVEVMDRPWQLAVLESAGPLLIVLGVIASVVVAFTTFRSRGPITVWVSNDRIAVGGYRVTGVTPLAGVDRPGADVRRFGGVLRVRGCRVPIPLRWFAPEDRDRLIDRFDHSWWWKHRRGRTIGYGRLLPRTKLFR